MNATETNWVNILLCGLLGLPMPNREIPTMGQAMRAAEALAHHSHQRHGKGISGADVEKHWPALRARYAASRTAWDPANIPAAAVDAVYTALDPGDEVYRRDAAEHAEIRAALAAAAPHLVGATEAGAA